MDAGKLYVHTKTGRTRPAALTLPAPSLRKRCARVESNLARQGRCYPRSLPRCDIGTPDPRAASEALVAFPELAGGGGRDAKLCGD